MKNLTLLSIFCLLFLGKINAQNYTPLKVDKRFKVQPKVSLQAYPFDLDEVTLLEGSPFKNAMDKDAAYLLSIEPQRLLHRFYLNAGLPTKGAVYGGWESEGLSGHTLGHYLSACAMMYASSQQKVFKDRVNEMVTALAACQKARKTGYVGAIPKEDSIFTKVSRGEIKSGGFDLNGGWSPWYTVHKVMAGLLDAYLYCGNQQALAVVTGMADWTGKTVNPLSPELLQKMLKCEYGGMAEVLANLYAITGKKEYLDLSYKFYDDFVMVPLSKRINPMAGKHSNTNVPKAIGSARQYELTGLESDKTIASFFWDIMVHHHTYVIGGNSNYEYCGEPDKLSEHLSDNTCETCNTYNMLKLTRHLFTWQPNSELTNYYERALYNHILASQNPESGMMCYFVPLRMGTKKDFSDQFNTFTCCVGSGMENHVKYNESIYFQGADGSLFVNLFIPSRLNWKDKGLVLTQQTQYPTQGNSQLTLELRKSQKFALKIRKPWWATNGVQVKVNGQSVASEPDTNGYIVVERTWNNRDQVTLDMPMQVYSESMPDNKDRIALLYGPLVLAGQLGKENPDPVYGIPVLLTDNKNVNQWVKSVENSPLTFKTQQVAVPFEVTLIPFYQSYQQHYSVYWDYFTKAGWEEKKAAYEAEKKRQKEIEDKTVDNFRIGEMQPERDHNLTIDGESYVSDALGRTGREVRKGGSFSFDLKIKANSTQASILMTYIGDDKGRFFDILVDGQVLATQELKGGTTGKFYDISYPLNTSFTANKDKIRVTIKAHTGKTAGRVFGVRSLE